MTLYEKIGNRYHPVQDTHALNGLSNGSWLITVEQGLTKRRKAIEDEDGLKVIAACSRWLTEWLVDELMTQSAYRYGRDSATLSNKEQKAYQKAVEVFQEIAGKDATMWMTRPSAMEVAEKVCDKLMQKIQEQ